ncbi:sodium/proline symporter [Pseudobutyrivibrio xylanivorans]|uniref:Sodium/proline symporter n=1 Tax=Pseudobutyrivibrio xylanivorans TaxID=185007 RepID=A0A1G5RSJ0_PSEXY|nr:sodium/proline symporter [Pseudobutyrivibrio xylanivorans]SCZ77044.1 sodium/proline symporter [Pseudobutyrivibrio xylanivorans]
MATLGIVIAIVIYLAALLIMGATFAKENHTVGDYYLGGRKLGPFVTAMSAEASDMSSWLLMGLPGVAYATGVCDVFWTALGLGIGTYVNWLLVAKRLRKYSEKNNSVTIPDFFENRFRDKSHTLMLISSLIIVVFFVPYVGSGFAACGKLFSSLFGLDYTIAMIASAAVIIGYTATGGFMAASVTDFIQSIIMTIALIAVVCFGLSTVDGISTVSTYSNSLDGYISLTAMHDFETVSRVSYGGIITIISTMAWGLGYFGMPHILLRFMAIEDPEKIKLSRRISTVWVFIAMGVAIFIGVMTRTMVHEGAIGELVDSERAIVIIAQTLAEHSFIASLLAGVILAGILACTMSTCDSQMLAASSSVSENILHETFGINLSEHMQMVMARVVLVIIAAIGVVIARDPNSSVFGIVSFAWAGFGAAFGPIMLLALFWKRANKYGAIAGMIGGGVMIFVWKFGIKPLGGIFGIYELLPAFIIALILCVVVSLLTPAPEKEIVEEFESIR